MDPMERVAENKHVAKVYAFPIGGRDGLRRNVADAELVAATRRRTVDVMPASAWYHEAAQNEPDQAS